MHELGIIKDLVHRVEAAALAAGADEVSGVEVWLGALSQMSADHFREHFREEVRGTVVEKAELLLEVSDDVEDPQAQSVVLKSIEMAV